MMAERRILPDSEAVARAAADEFVASADAAEAAGECLSIALSGGTTPAALYGLLAGEPWAAQVNWKRVHVFWGDERCVPPDHPGSNYRMARESFLDAVPIPPENVHRIRGELPRDEAAELYERELRAFFGTGGKQGKAGKTLARSFDLVFLGMGADGHTASLFPGSAAVAEQQRWVVGQRVDADPPCRVTLTPAALNAAARVIFLVTGASKAVRLSEVLEGKMRPDLLPAQAIRPTEAGVLWLVDAAAAAGLGEA
jgi:6-phosphogluconolactonase